MTLTASPPAEVSPEVQDAQARLARVDPLLVSDELRAATLRTARTAAFAREAQSHVTECREAVEAATAARDMHDARLAALELAAAERLVPMLPILAEDGAGDADVALAARLIDKAAGTLTDPPVLSFSAEMAAYRSLPERWLSKVEPPASSREDHQLADAIEAWSKRQREVRDWLAAWRRSAELHLAPALDLLADVRRLIDAAEAVSRDGRVLADQVNVANAQRRERGDEWRPVSADPPVSQYVTPATTALQAHRARMTATLAA